MSGRGAAFSKGLTGARWREPLGYMGSSKARNQIGAVVSPKNAQPLMFCEREREREVNCLTLTSSYSPVAPGKTTPGM